MGYVTSLDGYRFLSFQCCTVGFLDDCDRKWTRSGARSGPDPEQGILLLMAELLHQLIVYPIIYSGFYTSQVGRISSINSSTVEVQVGYFLDGVSVKMALFWYRFTINNFRGLYF